MSDVKANEDTVTVALDGREIQARKGELLIAAAERHGTYIPRFCYHERMKPVGMCRMCLVEVDTGRGPALQPSCMLECTDGMTVDTESEATKKAQEGVLEFLLVNHPLDCPVCDKGGECPLQDQTMAYGPGESRFLEEKRHYEKPIPVSDLVLLDRERCILCDRCTRFAKEVAGDPLIHFQDRGNGTQVNTFPDHPFASYFSGNTVQICPVGALTSSAYRFKARPWDLTETESTCTSCSVGCRIVIQASRNKVLRYQGVDVDEVNWGWLCDKGRFGFEAVGSEERLREPLLREEEGVILEPATWSHALGRAVEALRTGLASGGPEGVAVLGGARLTNEDAYAWTKFAKGVIGTDNVDCQMGDGLPPELLLGLPRASIDGALQPGGVVITLGSDIKEELPVLYLRLRHAVVEQGLTLIELSSTETGLTPLASHSLRYRPGDAPALAEALVAGHTSETEVAGIRADVIEALAELLHGGPGDDTAPMSPITLLVGRHNVAESDVALASAAATLVDGLPEARLLSGLRRANVHGALDMGMTPGLLPGGTRHDPSTAEGQAERDRFAEFWPRVPTHKGLDAEGILKAAAAGKIDTLFLVGADPLGDFPDRSLAERALAGARTVVACDLFMSESVRQADVVLPTAGFAEVDGTTTNLEGRVTSVAQKVTPPGTAQSDWITASELSRRFGYELGLDSVTEIWDEISKVAGTYAAVATPEHVSLPAVGERGGPRLPAPASTTSLAKAARSSVPQVPAPS
jgi:NADH-quinone oxidoreductase subunit G